MDSSKIVRWITSFKMFSLNRFNFYYLYPFLTGLYTVGAITDPTQLCGELLAVDCKVNYIMGERDETICGTNNMTYNNL